MAMPRRHLAGYWTLALLAGLNGCAGWSGSGSREATSRQRPTSPVDQPMSAVAAFSQGLRAGVTRLTDAVTTSETVVQEGSGALAKDDPTSLAHQPGPLSPRLFVMAAGLAQQNGRPDEARRQYRRALDLDPRDRAALIGLARLQRGQGEISQAIATYGEALSWYRDDPVILNDMGLCYSHNGQQDQAISLLRRAVQLQPDRQLYRNNLAAALVGAGRPDEAVAHLSQGAGLAIANYNVGYLLTQSGQPDRAQAYLQRSLELAPSLSQARQLLAQNQPRLARRPQATVGHPARRAASGPADTNRYSVRGRSPATPPAGDAAPSLAAALSERNRPASRDASMQGGGRQSTPSTLIRDDVPAGTAAPQLPAAKTRSKFWTLRLPGTKRPASPAGFVAPSPDR
jgi:Tfp pilus assembly protein PilF